MVCPLLKPIKTLWNGYRSVSGVPDLKNPSADFGFWGYTKSSKNGPPLTYFYLLSENCIVLFKNDECLIWPGTNGIKNKLNEEGVRFVELGGKSKSRNQTLNQTLNQTKTRNSPRKSSPSNTGLGTPKKSISAASDTDTEDETSRSLVKRLTWKS